MQTLIEIATGILLAIGFILLVKRSPTYAKEKWSFAIGLVVVALTYIAFGLSSYSIRWIVIELAGALIFAAFAWLGLKKSGWFLAAGWALHTLWDVGLHGTATPFVPPWYTGACLGFDLLVAGYIGFREINE